MPDGHAPARPRRPRRYAALAGPADASVTVTTPAAIGRRPGPGRADRLDRLADVRGHRRRAGRDRRRWPVAGVRRRSRRAAREPEHTRRRTRRCMALPCGNSRPRHRGRGRASARQAYPATSTLEGRDRRVELDDAAVVDAAHARRVDRRAGLGGRGRDHRDRRRIDAGELGRAGGAGRLAGRLDRWRAAAVAPAGRPPATIGTATRAAKPNLVIRTSFSARRPGAPPW